MIRPVSDRIRKIDDFVRTAGNARLFLVILASGFASRLSFALCLEPWEDLARYEMERAAISLAETRVLGNPYALETGPSGHIAPLYAMLLAAVFLAFGTGETGEIVKVLLSTFLSVLPYAQFPRLASSLELSQRFGFTCGFAAALIPMKPGSDLLGDWEAPAAAALLVLCMTGVANTWGRRELHTSRAIRQGVFWGIALLTAPAFLTLYLAVLVAGVGIAFAREIPGMYRFTAVQAVCTASLLLPWAWRNYDQLGSPVVTRTNVGLELRLSNNDHAGPNEILNFRAGLYHRYHPLQNPEEAAKVRDLGEVEYNRRAKEEAVAWMRANPDRFLILSLQRASLFWFPASDPIRSVGFAVLSIASVVGAVILLRRNLAAGLVLAIPLLIQPVPHYLVHVNVRHKYPIDWIGIIGLGIVVVTLYSFIVYRYGNKEDVAERQDFTGRENRL